MLSFVRRHLDPGARLGEILFGLVMALGFTGSVRLGLEGADNRELFVAILGCNLAWAIVDAAMYLLGELFERGRTARVVHEIRETPSDEDALARLSDEIDNPNFAVRVSNTVALAMLFLLGMRWGQVIGANPMKVGAGVTAVGVVLVLVTIALGG